MINAPIVVWEGPRLPYLLLLERYRARLDRTKDKAEREELETVMAVLAWMVDTQHKIDDMIVLMQKLIP